MEILRVENLCKNYGSAENIVKALDNVSFSVEKGEFVAIVGSSGSGKSTLIHLLGGVDKPSSGKVFVEGIDVYSLTESELAKFRRRKVGLIYQFYNLIPVLNVIENIKMTVSLDRKKVDEKSLNDLINFLGLEKRKYHLPNELSGGEQQRVAIGRALINSPAIILADELTGNLDSKNSNKVIELLKNLHDKYNQTIIMITHDVNIAKEASRVITIFDGKIISDEYLR